MYSPKIGGGTDAKCLINGIDSRATFFQVGFHNVGLVGMVGIRRY